MDAMVHTAEDTLDMKIIIKDDLESEDDAFEESSDTFGFNYHDVEWNTLPDLESDCPVNATTTVKYILIEDDDAHSDSFNEIKDTFKVEVKEEKEEAVERLETEVIIKQENNLTTEVKEEKQEDIEGLKTEVTVKQETPYCGILESVLRQTNQTATAPEVYALVKRDGRFEIRASPTGDIAAYAVEYIPNGTQLGPYDLKMNRVLTETGYLWQFEGMDGGKIADDLQFLIYLVCAKNVSEQNLIAFEDDGRLCYRSCKDIKPGDQLFVYYGNTYAKDAGIDMKNYFKSETRNEEKKEETTTRKIYCCKHCHIALSSEDSRSRHEIRCRLAPHLDFSLKLGPRPDKVPKCRYCNGVSNDPDEAKRHEERCTKKPKIIKAKLKEKRHKCKVCPYATDYSSNLRKHEVTHVVKDAEVSSTEKKIKCEFCDHTTNTKRSLNVHTTGVHSTNFPVYSCDHCLRVYKQRNSLENHVVKHHPEFVGEELLSRVLKCPNCSFKTINKSDMVDHMIIHNKDKADVLKCNECSYETCRRSNYMLHLRNHSGLKPYLCALCRWSFKVKSRLDEHTLLNHSDNEVLMKSITSKVYSCEQCKHFKTVVTSRFISHRKSNCTKTYTQ